MKKEFKQQHVHRIIIFRTDRIGEVVLSTGVIEALKKNFPQAKISFATSELAKDIVAARPDIDEVIIFDTVKRKISLVEAFILALKLRGKRFDMAVVLNPHRVIHLAVFLAAIPYRLGYNRKWGFLLTHNIADKRQEGRRHEVEYNLGLLSAIGINEAAIAPSIFIKPADIDYVKRLLASHNIASCRKIIVIHPGSSNPAKKWPFENFIELIKKIAAIGNVDIVLTGDSSEKDLCEMIKEGSTAKSVFNFAGLTTIRQLAALLKTTALFITNDSGPMHIAAALGTNVIAIFGRDIPAVGPKRWGPYSKGHIVFHKEIGCKPCSDKDCPSDFKCLQSIGPDEIFDAARSLLV